MFKISSIALAAALSLSTVSAEGDFNWDIPQPTVAVAFDDDNAGSEITVTYANANLADGKVYGFRVLSSDCSALGGNQITGSGMGTTASGADLVRFLGINQATIADSGYYECTDATADPCPEANITVCVRLDLCADINRDNSTDCSYSPNPDTDTPPSESVNFEETIIQITANMTKGFSVTGIQTNRTVAIQTNKAADLNYTVTAVQCADNNGTYEENDDPIKQGNPLEICVYTPTANVKVIEIDDMNWANNVGNFYAVTTGGQKSAVCDKGNRHA